MYYNYTTGRDELYLICYPCVCKENFYSEMYDYIYKSSTYVLYK